MTSESHPSLRSSATPTPTFSPGTSGSTRDHGLPRITARCSRTKPSRRCTALCPIICTRRSTSPPFRLGSTCSGRSPSGSTWRRMTRLQRRWSHIPTSSSAARRSSRSTPGVKRSCAGFGAAASAASWKSAPSSSIRATSTLRSPSTGSALLASTASTGAWAISECMPSTCRCAPAGCRRTSAPSSPTSSRYAPTVPAVPKRATPGTTLSCFAR